MASTKSLQWTAPGAPTLAQAGSAGQDNFLPLRHIAAWMVIYGHCYALAQHPPGARDWIAAWMPGFYAGSLAVYLFFAISGYLVTLSLLNRPGLLRYLRNRIARVFPAYILCLLISVLVLGPLFTRLPWRAYFSDAGTWHYLGENLWPIGLAWELPGVFAGNHYPHVVNGTLWSLGLEVRWYSYLGVLALLGVLRRRWLFSTAAAIFLLASARQWWLGDPGFDEHDALSMVFIGAALLAHWREYIRVSHTIMAALVLATALTHSSRWFGPMAATSAVYATFWIAYRLPAMRWPAGRDYSYGLFLYGFPIQQAVVVLLPDISPLPLLFAATLPALGLSMLSWHLLEAPVLRLNKSGIPARFSALGRNMLGILRRRRNEPIAEPADRQ